MRAQRRKLRTAEEGNALIEYALLAPVFFMLVMGLLEFVLYEYKVFALNHVVYEATRNLQTGEVQQSPTEGMNAEESADAMADAFHDAVCEAAGGMIDCEDILFDVRAYDAITDIEFPPVEYDEDGNPVSFVFEPGGAYKYSVVRGVMDHRFVTPFLGRFMGIDGGQDAFITTYAVVRNEPWS